jgi:uncharacterized protein (DUF362 family)
VDSAEAIVVFARDPAAGYEGAARGHVARLVVAALAEVGENVRSLLPAGGIALIKPNLVLDRHARGGELRCLVTNASVVEAVLKAIAPTAPGGGRIVVGDSPIQSTDFGAVAHATGLDAVLEQFNAATGQGVALRDFRQVVGVRDERGHILQWREQPGDPSGYVEFDLGADSMLEPLDRDAGRFRVSNYTAEDTLRYHRRGSHRYVVARSVLDADLIVSVPKMKTHCKVGVTLGLKNFVGTVGRKQCLAHHRQGGAADGGDEWPGRSRVKSLSERLERMIDGNPHRVRRDALKLAFRVNERLVRTLRIEPTRDGGWHGNDTCWRMALDLVRIARYGRCDGTMADTPQRRILTVVDGIVAGEGEGPLEAEPVSAGTIVAGVDPVAVDIATAAFMGFDYRRIPLLREALAIRRWPLTSLDPGRLSVRLNGKSMSLGQLSQSPERMRFRAPRGWEGHVEFRDSPSQERPAP